MVTIRQLVINTLGPDNLSDLGLSWGAKASAYQEQITAVVANGCTPVLVELGLDCALPDSAIIIDHHQERAGGPSALRQVFRLLELADQNWTRWHDMVDANDIGHVAGLRTFGATPEEIAKVRRADREAQGITDEEEQSGLAALADALLLQDQKLRVVALPHARTATVTDPLSIMGDTTDLLVISPASVNFYGKGDKIAALDRAFPGGWRGGALPVTGFWGSDQFIDIAALIDVLGAS